MQLKLKSVKCNLIFSLSLKDIIFTTTHHMFSFFTHLFLQFIAFDMAIVLRRGESYDQKKLLISILSFNCFDNRNNIIEYQLLHNFSSTVKCFLTTFSLVTTQI